MLGLLLPWRQQAAKPIEPAMTMLDHPAPCTLARFARSPWLPATTAHGRSTAKFAHSRAHFLIVVAFVQSHALRPLCRRLWSLRHNALDHRAHQLHVVAIGARSIATPMGTPCPSVNNDRLTPAFPRSVGLGAGFLPSPGHRPIHPQPRPVHALQFPLRYRN